LLRDAGQATSINTEVAVGRLTNSSIEEKYLIKNY